MPSFSQAPRREHGRLYDRLMQHIAGVLGLGARGVLIHEARQKLLIETAPIHADPHRLAVLKRDFDDIGELLVALVPEAYIARIDAVLAEGLRASGMFRIRACGRYNGSRPPAERLPPTSRACHGCAGPQPRPRCDPPLSAQSPSQTARVPQPAVRWSSTSAVSVFVMDCTTTGAPAPTVTPPTFTAVVMCLASHKSLILVSRGRPTVSGYIGENNGSR